MHLFRAKKSANMILSIIIEIPPKISHGSNQHHHGRDSIRGLFRYMEMKSLDGSFYKSTAWKRCREEFLKTHVWCEECLKENKFTPATHVHHKTFLNAQNVNDPTIALCFDNLEAVCHDCHNKIHFGKAKKRYVVDEWGRISPHSDY